MKGKCKKLILVISVAMIFSIIALGYKLFKNEHNTTSSDSMIFETQKMIFGEWEISKLIGFTEVQNDYTIYPDGHDIIGDHIIINEKLFSSKGIYKYERYQSEILNPIYALSGIDDQYIMEPIEAIKEDTEIYDMINQCTFDMLSIKDKFNEHASVSLWLTSDNHLILEIDCEFYLLKKIK